MIKYRVSFREQYIKYGLNKMQIKSKKPSAIVIIHWAVTYPTILILFSHNNTNKDYE